MKKSVKIFVLCLAVVIAACSGPIDFRDYTNGEEIRYAGKVNELICRGGKDRLAIEFKLGPDPNVKEVRIYWNMKRDSVTLDVDGSTEAGLEKSVIIENLKENTYNFEVRTFDKFGNISVPSYITGKTYNKNYATSIISTRPITDMSGLNSKKDLKVFMGDSIPLNYSVGLEFIYKNTAGEEVSTIAPDRAEFHILEDFDYAHPLYYRSVFEPERNALDWFYGPKLDVVVDKEELEPDVTEVEKPYAAYNDNGFSSPLPTKPNEYIDNAWDTVDSSTTPNLEGTNWADACGWNAFQSQWWPDEQVLVEADDFNFIPKPQFYTLDLGEPMKLARIHVYFYWPFTTSYPRQMEYYAYTGAGEPGDNWDNWELIGTSEEIKSRETGEFESEAEAYGLYIGGQITRFPVYKEALSARYYRMKCVKGGRYNNSQTAEAQSNIRAFLFSMSEFTFYKYND